MIAQEITKKIQEAMKAKDEIRLSTLRMLSSALNYEKIAKQHDLTEDEELVVVQKEAKIRKDAIDALQQAKGKNTTSSADELLDKLKKEEEELKILQEYIPEEMGEKELSDLVIEVIKETGAEGMKDMGRVIGAVKAKVGMKAEGGRIAQLVKERLG